MCTSVASRVRGHDRAAVLERAVVAEDDVQHGLGRARAGSPAMSSISRRIAVVAERDLAEQLAGVGQVDRAAVRRVGLELADVVQQRAGHRDVAVDARERRADRADRLGDARASARAARARRPGGSAWRPARRGRPPRSACPRRGRGRAARAGAGSGRSRAARAGRPPSPAAPRGGPSSRSASSKVPGSAGLNRAPRAAGPTSDGPRRRRARGRAGRATQSSRWASTSSQTLTVSAPVRSPSVSFRKVAAVLLRAQLAPRGRAAPGRAAGRR